MLWTPQPSSPKCTKYGARDSDHDAALWASREASWKFWSCEIEPTMVVRRPPLGSLTFSASADSAFTNPYLGTTLGSRGELRKG